jgi:hypothetical protein
MITIPRKGQLVPVKIGEVTFFVKPLDNWERSRILGLNEIKSGERKIDPVKLAWETLKAAVKGVEGVFYEDGEKVELKFDEEGRLLDDSLEELSYLEQIGRLTIVASNMLRNAHMLSSPGSSPDSGELMEGIDILPAVNGVPVEKKTKD